MVRKNYEIDDKCFDNLSEYMSSPVSTIKDLKKCYSFLIEYLKEMNSSDVYNKGFLQIEGAVDKFLKCANSVGFDDEKEYVSTISVSKNLAYYMLKYYNTTENFIQIISYNLFNKNNQKKALKNNCEELFLTLFNKINTIYNKILTQAESRTNNFDIFNFYHPENIERVESVELLQEIISVIIEEESLSKNEKSKIISRIKSAVVEINNTYPDIVYILGSLNEVVLVLKSIASDVTGPSSIDDAKNMILKIISIVEKTCIDFDSGLHG